jgi:intracellular multiplication protein IcmO
MNTRLERKSSALMYDTRRLGERLNDAFANEEVVTMAMAGFGVAIFFGRQLSEFIFLLAVAFFFYARRVQKNAGLALRMPKSSGEIDPKEIHPGTMKPTKAGGIVYMGNDKDSGEEIWLTDNQARTHMLFMGTTGSGKTEYLISLVYNALIHGSGLIYVDGKADSSLYGKVYSMARSMGREDDVLVINFQTGAKDIYGAQPSKLSNTLNPFAVGSSGMLSELVKGLMATGEKSTWTQQAESFVEALMKPLVYLRDNHGLNLDVNVVREYFELNKLEDLAWREGDKHAGLVESGALDGLHAYLLNKPGYKKEKYHDQSETTHEQHGYITMQLGRTFNSLSDTYGYIMKTPLAEIDFVDVFLNRRILVVLLPALEKSPTELTNLGRIVVASIKATMAKGLGSAIEGDWKKVIESKPTTSPSPFMCVLDEYGYYAVDGFAVVPAQARSLGFSAIFAGQDLPAFEKASKEEAKSTLANTNTKLCGKLECVDTFKYFQSLGGQGLYTRLNRYETDPGSLGPTGFKAETNVSVERMDRVNLEGLRGQISGEWNLFYGNTMLRVKSFFADPKPVQQLRVNHFLKVGRPDPEEVAAFKKSSDAFTRAVMADGGLKSYMDSVSSPSDIADINEGFKLFKGEDPLLAAGLVLAYCARIEAHRAKVFTGMTSSDFEPDEGVEPPIDFTGEMGKHAPASTAWGGQDTPPWTGGDAAPEPVADVDTHTRGLFRDDFDAGDVAVAEPVVAVKPAPTPLPDGMLDGIPSDVVAPEGEGDFADFPFADEGAPAAASSNPDDLYGDGFDASPEEAVERVPLIAAPAATAYDVTSVFGVETEEMPDAIAQASNDVEPDATDRPTDVDAFAEEEFAFDQPAAVDGLLDREATVSGMAAIERATGASEEEARMTASIVTSDMGDTSTYPLSPPAKKPDLEQFASIGEAVLKLLSATAEKEG